MKPLHAQAVTQRLNYALDPVVTGAVFLKTLDSDLAAFNCLLAGFLKEDSTPSKRRPPPLVLGPERAIHNLGPSAIGSSGDRAVARLAANLRSKRRGLAVQANTCLRNLSPGKLV